MAGAAPDRDDFLLAPSTSTKPGQTEMTKGCSCFHNLCFPCEECHTPAPRVVRTAARGSLLNEDLVGRGGGDGTAEPLAEELRVAAVGDLLAGFAGDGDVA